MTLRLPPEIEAELTALAKRTGRTKTFYAREAILNDLEDMKDARIADDRIAAFEASGKKGIPWAEVMKRYGGET